MKNIKQYKRYLSKILNEIFNRIMYFLHVTNNAPVAADVHVYR